jgi:phosphohistidine phosphatase SixA
MKFLNIICITGLLCFTSCSFTRYYVVRHAEKLNNTEDSPLNPDGIKRAKVLADTLKNKAISKVYVSNRIRTQQTAAPTATLFNLTPVITDESATDNLIMNLKNQKKKNILVVWHSQSVHLVVNELSPNDQILPIGNTFHHMFLVTRRQFLGSKKYTLKRLIYGLLPTF